MIEETKNVVDVEASTLTASSSISKEATQVEAQQQDDLPEKEKRLIKRKIDLRVAFLLGIINCISVMDRSSLGAAGIAGVSRDLQLTVERRYSIVALIFFIPFIIFEFVSTILVTYSGTRPLLTTAVILWGVVMIGSGLTKSWQQLAVCRAILGLLESCFYPVVINLLPCWYTRYEVQKRFAIFFLVTAAVASFTGILAYGLTRMDGLGGLPGWRWIFIMQGILTVVGALVVGFFIVDYPAKARSTYAFLSDRQVDWVIDRLRKDRDDVDDEPFCWRKFLRAGLKVPIWIFALILCCTTTVAHSVSFYMPFILRDDMKFPLSASLCLSAPPYLFSAITMYISSWVGDKYRVRGPILIFNTVVASIGLIILGFVKTSWIRYASIFFITGGTLANIPAAMAYQSNNVCGQWERAFNSAAFVGGGGLGGVFGALMFANNLSHGSKQGVYACLGANGLLISLVLGLTVFFRHQNHLAKQGRKLIYGKPDFLYSL